MRKGEILEKIFNKQYNFVHFVLYFVFFKLHE